MGASKQPDPAPEITDWLAAGGLVVAASERAARALQNQFHRSRRAQNLSAWPSPAIFHWQTFLRTAWQDFAVPTESRLILDALQEQSLWASLIGSAETVATVLEGPRNRMAALAMSAHNLLCSYSPQHLRRSARSGWEHDAASFSSWLGAFDDACRSANLISPARLPLELAPLLENATAPRPPLLLAGFDRILPSQRRLFEAWGRWQQTAQSTPTTEVSFYSAADRQSELAACALWCKLQLAANPAANLLVITEDLATRRGEIERAFLNISDSLSTAPLFEFSLGIPLSQVALARGASLFLHWLSAAISENELDWLLSTGQLAASPEESIALQTFVRNLRDRSLERPRWSIHAFLSQPLRASLPTFFVARIQRAHARLKQNDQRAKAPLEWAELAPQLLQDAGWPGHRPLASAEFQASDRFQQALESCAALGFDGRRLRWSEFLDLLAQALDQTLFAPESRYAPIQITGPSESAGLTADAVWFMGASESTWPASGSLHALLPLEVQRAASMPHATAQLDWELSRAITARLLASAPRVCFSYARQSDNTETRPSRLIEQLARHQELPDELKPCAVPSPLTVIFEDASLVPFPPGKVEGGSAVLTQQSQCAFKAFATARLGASHWDPAQPSLTPSQRGQLLHAVLHAIWSGPPAGLASLSDLKAVPDVSGFVQTHVHQVLAQKLPGSVRERMPHRYLELEAIRLTRLVTEWLAYESTRVHFEVHKTEAERPITVGSLTFDLRLDRLDRLTDGTLLVIDYKTGNVSPSSWELPRPDDVQLPLYAGFALEPADLIGGLVFAKVRSGKDQCFSGFVGDARTTLKADLGSTTSLVKYPFTAEQLDAWKEEIEKLAVDFLAGRADVNPSNYPNTCEHCGLQSLCRVAEKRALLETESVNEAADE
jgi:ATP-dependent helicase/nuclease subunit B